MNIRLIFWVLFFLVITFFLIEVSSILAPFILSFLIAYFLDPLTKKLENLGIKRNLTVSLIVGIFFITIILGLLKLVPVFFEQVKDFIVAIPSYEKFVSENILNKISIFIAKIDPKIANEIRAQLSNFSSKFFEYLVMLVQNILNSSLAVFNVIAIIFFTPILVFYLLRDWPAVEKHINDLVPLSHKTLILEQFKQIDMVLSSCVRGQLTVCMILSLFYVVSLSLLGLEYSLLVGIVAGFLSIIPYVGLIAGGAICTLVALLQFSELSYMYITLVIFVVGHILESCIITPKLVGEKIGLHPVWVIFALMSGGALFGFWGMFLAIPVAAILGVLIRGMIKLYLASYIYTR